MSLRDLVATIKVDPKFFVGATPTDQMCQGCFIRPAEHIHHKEAKKMGGRKGEAKKRIEAPENKIALCEVCHRASHHLRYFASDGFNCALCPEQICCYYGACLLGLDSTNLTPRW